MSSSHNRSRKALLALPALLALLAPCPAHAQVTISYTSGGYSQTGLGNLPNDYAKLFFTPVSNTVTLTPGVPVWARFNDFRFSRRT